MKLIIDVGESKVLYNLNEYIYIIDPTNKEYSDKIFEKIKSIIGNKVLYSLEKIYNNQKNDPTYRDCVDIAFKIISCLYHKQNDVNSRTINEIILKYHSTQGCDVIPKIKGDFTNHILKHRKRFTTDWKTREIIREHIDHMNNFKK